MKKIEEIPCIILSGGRSSRMGEDKSLLPFKDEKTLIQYQYKRFSSIFQNVYISSKTDKFDFPCKIIYDKSEIYSPMIALKSTLNYFEIQKVFIVSVDTPFIKYETIIKLLEKSKEEKFDVTICADEIKIHNLIGVFRTNVIKNIDELLENDNHKINFLLTQKVTTQTILFDDVEQFTNINTKEEYLKIIS